jgi:hypothetical protein
MSTEPRAASDAAAVAPLDIEAGHNPPRPTGAVGNTPRLVAEEEKKPENNTVMKGTTVTQIKMLLWKNARMKMKKPCSTFSEILLPVLIILLLSWLRSLSALQPKSQEIGMSFVEEYCLIIVQTISNR